MHETKINQAQKSQRFSIAQTIKTQIPHGVDGRFYLILLLPAIILVLLGSVLFVQKHFDRVTRQMVSNFAPQFEQVLRSINSEETKELASEVAGGISRRLGMELSFIDNQGGEIDNQRVFYDFSGLIITDVLQSRFTSIRAIDLTINDLNDLNIFFTTNHGWAKVKVGREILSPSNPHQYLILIVLIGILTSFISILYLRNQIKPIKRLAKAVDAFATGHEYQLKASGAIEVRSAINAFISMRDTIREQIDQRSQLLVNISHDIRTPLTRLRLEAELINQPLIKQALIEDIEQMDTMLEGLLNFVATGEKESFSPINLIQLIKKLVEESNWKDFELNTYVSEEAHRNPMLLCRPLGIKRSLENLIANSVRHATKAKINLHYRSQTFILTVEDDGPGIAKNLQKKALQPFTRLDNSRNLNQSGSVGLGLAIVDKTIIEHGGSVFLSKSSELGGLRVQLKVPAQPPETHSD